MSTTLTETRHAGGFLASISPGTQSFEAVTITGGALLLAGTVLGQVESTLGATVAAKAGGNTGTGTLTMDATNPVLAYDQVGLYTVVATGATTFSVFDVEGHLLGTATAGQVFADQIKFTIATGGTAFVAGDTFLVTVGPGLVESSAGKYAQFNPTATNGTQVASAILFADADASGGDVKQTVVKRGAEVNASEIIWPSGITANQIALGLTQLSQLASPIIAR